MCGGYGGGNIRITVSLQACFGSEPAQLLYRKGTFYTGFGEVEYRIFGKQGKHTADVLVIDHSYDDMELAVGLLFQLFYDVGNAAHIMTGITYQGGRLL